MTSTRPYLLRAIYDWIVDNGLTPHLLVDAEFEQVCVPRQYVEKGVIVLNVSPNAVRDLDLGNEFVSFNARFAGKPEDIFVPIGAVQAVYARENGQGIFLGEHEDPAGASEDQATGGEDSGEPTGARESKQRAPHLTVVK